MLPKMINEPLFEDTIPSSKKKILFRPFVSKEHKILLIAKSSDDPVHKLNAVKQIVSLCIQDKIDIDSLPQVDLEYLFLKIRAKSVNNIVNLAYRDKEDNKVYKFEVNIDDLKVIEFEDHTNKIEVAPGIGIVMKYPTVKISESLKGDNEVDLSFDLIRQCIDVVYDADNVYPFADESYEDQITFIESLSVPVYEKINEFFQTMPRLQHNLEYTNANGKHEVISLRGIDDFFQWG